MDKIKIRDVNLLLLIVLMLTFIVKHPYSHILTLIITQAWAGRNDLKLRDFLYLNRPIVSIVLLSMIIGVLLALMNVFNYFYFRFSIESIGEDKFSLSMSTFWFLFSICFFGPLVEELFFRGFLYNFYKKKGILTAVTLSSMFFSIFHFNLHGIIMIFILGVFLALLYEITQCFWIPVLIHCSINAVGTLLLSEPMIGSLNDFLFWLHGDNVWFFRIKLLFVSIMLCIFTILVMFLVMRISGNNIFEGRKIKDLISINKNDDEPLIDKYFISVFIIFIGIIVWALFFMQS